MPQATTDLKAISMRDLQTPEGIGRLDGTFLAILAEKDDDLYQQLLNYRQTGESSEKASPYFLMALSQHMEAVLAELFDVQTELMALNAMASPEKMIAVFKGYYLKKATKRGLKKQELADEPFPVLQTWLSQLLPDTDDTELAIAELGAQWLQDKDAHADDIERLIVWCIAALTTQEGRQATHGMTLFHRAAKLDYVNLVNEQRVPNDPFARCESHPDQHRQRDGFELTDSRMNTRQVYDQIHYCAYCHKNAGDFCSTGFPVKKKNPELGFKINPAGDLLTGCPLEERISEMHYLKRDGYSLAALAMITRDNPMCAATGHRICNDCMKSCIYQKHEPVNIPQVETAVLTDILGLPFGAEIYLTLIRWNPLRAKQYASQPYNGLKVAVMGMGPAGFTLAHHLLMEGCAVVGFDGLKIEPLDRTQLMEPIRCFSDLTESLSDRVMAGFGGVAEYGITVRWDKNFLKLILISLMRRPRFQLFGSVRFGGTLTVPDVWALGFDHLALAVGAGLPKELSIPNSLAPGMRQANDFLMSLQLTGAAKSSSLANLQVRLPAVVIGGGLTGVDTATEIQAYYCVQIQKIADRYHALVAAQGVDAVRAQFIADDLVVLDEYLQHASELAHERQLAQDAGRPCDTLSLLRQWGGVTIAYRRNMQQSPAYQRNHEELTKALEEGIYYAEALEPEAVILDPQGHAKALRCRWRIMNEEGDWMTSDETQDLPARSIFVATGAKPNVAYGFEHQGTFERKRYEYQRFEWQPQGLTPAAECAHVKDDGFGAFTSYQKDHHRVSFLGDTHPVFHGSVVKAIASAARVYPEIVASLQGIKQSLDTHDYPDFHDTMKQRFSAAVVSVRSIGPALSELIVHAPMARQQWTPGQFYRLQNYEVMAKTVANTQLQMEALALMGIPVANEPDQLRFIIHEVGVSSVLASRLQPGEPVALMGPSGVPYRLADKPETVLVMGGLYAMLFALSAGHAFKAAGHRLVLVVLADEKTPRIHADELEACCSAVNWGSDALAETLADYQADCAQEALSLAAIDRVMVIDSKSILQQVQDYRQSGACIVNEAAKWTASVYGPMQCMLKGVCAQCLQWQVDPKTGKRTKAVYACSWHQQPIDIIDIHNLGERATQNRMQETLGQLWLNHILETAISD